MTTYSVYCDESCHLENDGQPVMVLGAVWCDQDRVKEVSTRLRELKEKHGLPAHVEMKWTKLSPSKVDAYLAWVDYFFDDDDLHLRALVARKDGLRHKDFNQDHDLWYYKMCFQLLTVVLDPKHSYRIFLDYKDTRSAARIARLREVLGNSVYEFDRGIVTHAQAVRSHEVQLLQLVDVLTGAVGYANRPLEGPRSAAKKRVVERIRDRTKYSLNRSTLLGETKVNIFHWSPQAGVQP